MGLSVMSTLKPHAVDSDTMHDAIDSAQGKLLEDFASLLKSLWSQEYLCVFPSKFKRGLIKYKPQFAGNEQQDSQVLA